MHSDENQKFRWQRCWKETESDKFSRNMFPSVFIICYMTYIMSRSFQLRPRNRWLIRYFPRKERNARHLALLSTEKRLPERRCKYKIDYYLGRRMESWMATEHDLEPLGGLIRSRTTSGYRERVPPRNSGLLRRSIVKFRYAEEIAIESIKFFEARVYFIWEPKRRDASEG